LSDTFRFTWATNDGAFLSLGGNLPEAARFWLLTVGVGVLLLSITIYALKTGSLDAAHLTGYALIVSGGFSNWVDRARYGGVVVDFMNLGLGRLRTGVFNVADLSILAGIGVLLVAGWKLERAAKAEKLAQAAAAVSAGATHPAVSADPGPVTETPRENGP
jgi:signal peptidase II